MILAASTAYANPPAICADVQRRMRDRSMSVAEAAASVRGDDRIYSKPVLECLCVIGAPPEVQREARRRVLRDTVPVDAATWTIATDDPLTSPSFQVSALLGRRLEAAVLRPVPMIALGTRIEEPDWLDIDATFRLFREFEVAGTLRPDRGWLVDQDIGALPTGSLTTLSDDDTIASFSLLSVRGTYDRALWFDLAPTDDGQTVLRWNLLDITSSRPYPPLAADHVRLEEVAAPLVVSCDAPMAPMVRTWQGKLQWPASRITTSVTGAVLAAVFGGLALNDYLAFQAQPEQDLVSLELKNRNLAFGSVAVTGAVLGVAGLAIPGRIWRR